MNSAALRKQLDRRTGALRRVAGETYATKRVFSRSDMEAAVLCELQDNRHPPPSAAAH